MAAAWGTRPFWLLLDCGHHHVTPPPNQTAPPHPDASNRKMLAVQAPPANDKSLPAAQQAAAAPKPSANLPVVRMLSAKGTTATADALPATQSASQLAVVGDSQDASLFGAAKEAQGIAAVSM